MNSQPTNENVQLLTFIFVKMVFQFSREDRLNGFANAIVGDEGNKDFYGKMYFDANLFKPLVNKIVKYISDVKEEDFVWIPSGDKFTTKSYDFKETSIANCLIEISKRELDELKIDTEGSGQGSGSPLRVPDQINLTITEEQKSAIDNFSKSPFTILRGRPGTGKSVTLKILLQSLKKLEEDKKSNKRTILWLLLEL